ncbi:MAG: NAD(P)-dependent oxidoreductase [Rhodospirillaceae bacterium]
MTRILVIGASSGIGKAVSRDLIARGHTVRAMSRSGGAPAANTPALEIFRGDALIAEDVRKALDGVETVVQALGVAPNLSMITGPVTLFSEATRVLLPTMQEAGVSRLISVTGFGAGDCRRAVSPLQVIPFRAMLGRAYDDKTIQEDLITGSDLDWLIVRPGVLTNGPKTAKYKVLSAPDTWRNGIISRADVADYIGSQIGENPLGGRKPVLIRYCIPL